MRASVFSTFRRWLLPWLASLLTSSSFGALRVAEFLADNETGLVDEDLAHSDWIEIENPDGTAVALSGYHLTDDPGERTNLAATHPADLARMRAVYEGVRAGLHTVPARE